MQGANNLQWRGAWFPFTPGRDMKLILWVSLLIGLLLLTGAAMYVRGSMSSSPWGKRLMPRYFFLLAMAVITLGVVVLYRIDSLLPYLPGHEARNALEVTYFIAQTVIAVLAFVTLLFVRKQVEEAKDARIATLRQSRATFLLELDRRWDTPEVNKSLRSFRAICDEELKRAASSSPQGDESTRVSMAVAAFTIRLREMRNDDSQRERYNDLLTLPNLLETIGVMVKKGYVGIEDIADLFERSILDFGMFFKDHICERREEPGVPKRFLQNAVLLADRVAQLRSLDR